SLSRSESANSSVRSERSQSVNSGDRY
ncbi:hypothetical protein A2U01_0033669, partial [Trifolium medium]|nr:hypothetical protein [Trifolium medium]